MHGLDVSVNGWAYALSSRQWPGRQQGQHEWDERGDELEAKRSEYDADS